MELVHMTVTYSNALLVAILPHVSDFAKKLELPIPQPIVVEQVREFRPSPYKEFIGGAVILTNGDWFTFNNGAVDMYRSPEDAFTDDNPSEDWPKYAYGKDNMTTNDALALARASLTKLGYKPELLGCDVPPRWVSGPFDLKDGNHVPYYQMRWQRYTEPKNLQEQENNDFVTVEINMNKKAVIGLNIASRKIQRDPPKVSVTPELEKDFKRRSLGTPFTRTNAPPTFPEK
jgi:hypothetical protein